MVKKNTTVSFMILPSQKTKENLEYWKMDLILTGDWGTLVFLLGS